MNNAEGRIRTSGPPRLINNLKLGMCTYFHFQSLTPSPAQDDGEPWPKASQHPRFPGLRVALVH